MPYCLGCSSSVAIGEECPICFTVCEGNNTHTTNAGHTHATTYTTATPVTSIASLTEEGVVDGEGAFHALVPSSGTLTIEDRQGRSITVGVAHFTITPEPPKPPTRLQLLLEDQP